MDVVSIVLTYNSERSIQRTLDSLIKLRFPIFVVDSFSADRTVQICKDNGCDVVQREFSNYAEQRNWAIQKLKDVTWQLHIDADEEINDILVKNIEKITLESCEYDGFIFCRKIVFMNKILRFGGISKTWHMRLFRSAAGRVEDRLYDQHFICDGTVKALDGCMLDHQEMSLSEWTARHNKWSDFEVDEIMKNGKNVDIVRGNIAGNKIERKRFSKNLYYKCPLFLRSISYFIYRYFVKLGFMDGRRGLVYHLLQGFWFRFLVDAKIFERKFLDKVD